MKIIVATDSYKGTFTASEACGKIADALIAYNKELDVVVLPIADGGEGTLDSYKRSTDIVLHQAEVTTPDRFKIVAEYGIMQGGAVAIIESAKAIGLNRITTEKNPLLATSYGLGELITHALNKGVKKVYISLGDSGINDGGIGMAVALGCKCYDAEGYEFLPTGGTLHRLDNIDFSGLDNRISAVEFIGLADVTNPLLGTLGATQVFAPQKGARAEDLPILEQGLATLAQVCKAQGIKDNTNTPSSGACGGVGFGILTFLKGSIQSGISTVLDQLDIRSKAVGADIIITGEGKLDSQTLGGKAITGIAKIAQQSNAKLLAVVGINQLTTAQSQALGINQVYQLNNNNFNEVAQKITAYAKHIK